MTSLPPAPQRWAAYFKERFKIGTNLIATALLVGAAAMASLRLHELMPTTAVLGPLSLISAVYVLIFLHLRVFDEHKDYAVDSVRFPQRVLSKGWVTLPQLRRIANVAIPLEVIIAGLVGPRFLVATLTLIAYSLLMLKEFFVADWLKRHMVLYGMSHMAILFLMVLGVFVGIGDRLPPGFQPFASPLLIYGGTIYAWVYSLEIARKIRAPEKEMPDVDTYSKILGPTGAIIAVIACQLAGLGLLAISRLPVPLTAWYVIGGMTLLEVIIMAAVAARPTAAKLAKLDNVAALPFLTLQLALIIGWARG
ncbi:MAG: hypothetical protein H7338_20365 [Candidatus Sericytochromatia bacterium]|nr:hypothetical protein [Candidatus Sericytochromatia bacterium]